MSKSLLQKLKDWYAITFRGREKCRWGNGYHPTSNKNCQKLAEVRIKIGDRSWTCRCERHSRWPTVDRSRWLDDLFTVEKWEDGEWQEWEDYEIRTPKDKRYQ